MLIASHEQEVGFLPIEPGQPQGVSTLLPHRPTKQQGAFVPYGRRVSEVKDTVPP
ncbi:hypothetical protein CCICO_00505 [Corynebacterium ciconiae DSM 44920]|nr:hypothetical protein CCICO_00505 [Corynebacterium ciconiae DSM 44920]